MNATAAELMLIPTKGIGQDPQMISIADSTRKFGERKLDAGAMQLHPFGDGELDLHVPAIDRAVMHYPLIRGEAGQNMKPVRQAASGHLGWALGPMERQPFVDPVAKVDNEFRVVDFNSAAAPEPSFVIRHLPH